MSEYARIDEALSDWAARRGVVWLSNYRDAEVRTFFLGDATSQRIQIWVEPPRGGELVLHAAENTGRRGSRSACLTSPIGDLPAALDEIAATAGSWLTDRTYRTSGADIPKAG